MNDIPIPYWYPIIGTIVKEVDEKYSETTLEAAEDTSHFLHALLENLKRSEYHDLKHVLPLLQFFNCCSGKTIDKKEDLTSVVVDYGAFIFIPLFFLWHLRPAFLLKYMSCRTCTKQIKPQFLGISMKTGHQFHVGFVDSGYFQTNPMEKKLEKPWAKLLNTMVTFVTNQFIVMTEEEKRSIQDAFLKGRLSSFLELIVQQPNILILLAALCSLQINQGYGSIGLQLQAHSMISCDLVQWHLNCL
jgi:hypothetical protein